VPTQTATESKEIQSASGVCQSCQGGDLAVFYQSNSVPVNSCLLLDSEEEARRYPTGQIRLAYCRQCGFIGNTAFNPELARYNTSYEEQQSFSPRFQQFAKDLAQRWIETHGIRGKTILEIGCGKGDFLLLFCQLGANRGIGIDPSYVPGRHHDKGGQVTFIPDFYSPRYSHLQADVVCCRHTLEHIPDTAAFMHMVRQSIGDRPDTLVLFELPDVYRVLKECAFWDIYYEHCSYFSLGSLARLFRRTGFDVLDLCKEYDDQYLLIEARLGDGRSPLLPREDDLTDLASSVEEFRLRYEENVRTWKQKIAAYRDRGKRVAIWGSGSKCVAFLNTLGINEDIGQVVDINPYRHGKFLPATGKQIASPQALMEYRPDLVIAMNPVYLNEIGRDLRNMGVDSELTAV